MPVVASSVMAERNQPAGLLSLAWTVKPVGPSGAVRPFIETDGSLASSFCSSVAPVGAPLAPDALATSL